MKHPNTPAPGPTHIQQYDILDCIGRGGMGLVYLARDTRLERQVAIKYLRTELFEPHYRERFKREALLLAKLNHPNIVQIYDFIESPEQLALVMEYVDGKNLQQHLREHVVLLSLRITWLTQIAQGLAVAHDAGIIHRDLKFENILITQRNVAKITDLGIAKSQDFNSTLTDHVTGSYCSMSPEQARGDNIDFKSDLFSFGILAYQLLCGAHPFGDTSNKLQLMQRIILQPPTPPIAHNPNLPAEAVNLLGQLLSKDPNDRPQNTHSVAEQCKNISQYLIDIPLDSDNTMVLTPTHTHRSQAGLRQANSRTQDHPTFDTRFETKPFNAAQKIHRYIKYHMTAFVSIVLIAIILLGASIWYFIPKPARYIAVLPPQLTSDVMPESQQALVKDAVYDAIQQSVLQLDGYYLIPRDEIADINASNNKEGLEVVRRATAADELVTTNIQCKIESCTIVLSRLTPDGKKQESRLRVQDTKTVDVLTDNYLLVAITVQKNIGELYLKKITNSLEKINESEYSKFLEINNNYRSQGSSRELLDKLDGLNQQTKNLPAAQTLYSEIALDLHYETRDPIYLTRLEKYTSITSDKEKNIIFLCNLFYLQIAKSDFSEALKTISEIEKINSSYSLLNELSAYFMMAEKDYESAISFYKKSLTAKKTASSLYYISNAYWNSGNTDLAKVYLDQSLALSSNNYRAKSLYGTIALYEGNTDKAINFFESTLALKTNDVRNINNLGLCYLLKKQYNDALKLFNNAVQLAPENLRYLLNKADSEELLDKTSESEKTYASIVDTVKKANSSTTNLRFSAQAHAHLGQYSEALTTLQELEKIDPQNIETTYTAALIHTLAGNKASATLNIENTLKNGLNKIWFNFIWFDSLCSDLKFTEIMKKNGEPNRCALHNTIKDAQAELKDREIRKR